MKKYYSNAQRVFGVFNVLFLFATALVCVLPFVNLLAISLSYKVPVDAGKVLFWPVDFTLESYSYMLTRRLFRSSFLISILRVLIGVPINIILCVLTAYPLSHSKERFIGRNWYMAFFVLTMIIGGGLIPTYLVVRNLNLLNTIWALILPGALPVGNMIIIMNFMRQMPAELEDAAFIDGAGPVDTLARIILPLLKPAIATIGLFCIVGHWNDWFNGLVYMRNQNMYPLQTYLHTLLRNFDEILNRSNKDYLQIIAMINARTGRAAQIFIAALPVMIIYPFLQRYFVTGLTIGSVKG